MIKLITVHIIGFLLAKLLFPFVTIGVFLIISIIMAVLSKIYDKIYQKVLTYRN